MVSFPSYDSFNKVFIFINNTVEENSTVLFLDFSYFILGQPFLYPHVKSDFVQSISDQELLLYLRENLIHYIIIVDQSFPLALNTSLFSKIEFDSSIYLLKINKSAL